jgi:hypothetical protein
MAWGLTATDASRAEFAIRLEIPSSKIQIPKNLQCAKSEFADLDFEPCSAWSLLGAWSLEIGLFATFTVTVSLNILQACTVEL